MPPFLPRQGFVRICCAVALLLLSAAVFAMELPKDHPSVAAGRSRKNAAAHDLAQTISQPGTRPVPRRNYIDEFIFGKMQQDGVPHAGLAADPEFARRVHLDLTGRLPEPEALRKFLQDADPNKRDKLIDELMATPIIGQIDKPETPFLDRWTYFFGDLFRTTSSELGKGRDLFRDYLYLCLLANLPYDQIVREMLTASARSNWLDGPVNFLARDHVDDFNDILINQEDTYDEIAITTARVFLGVNLECVACHDGKGHNDKINLSLTRLNREQLWRQGAFFSRLLMDRPYSIGQEMRVMEQGKGYDLNSRSVRFMPRYKADLEPEFLLTGEKPRPGEDWREAFARMLTGHPQFARATVNLIWAELMGAGIVDPPFSFDLDRQDPKNPPPGAWPIQPSHPELLEALARDFREHGFDLRYVIRLIVTSSAYQLAAHFDAEWKERYAVYFARHLTRRLSAAEICDAISQATGVFDPLPAGGGGKKVRYVMQTYSHEDISGKELDPLKQLLQFFNQENRETLDRDRSGSMVQASALLNSKFVKERVRVQENGRLQKLLNRDPQLSNEQIIEELFLACLSRFPRPNEREIGVKTLQERHSAGLEDLAWSLINKPEFILNH